MLIFDTAKFVKSKSYHPLVYRILLTVFLFFNVQFLRSQESFSDNLSVNLTSHLGFVLPEYQFINLIANDYTRSIGLDVLKETKGKSEWEQRYNYPAYGLSFFYSTLGNDKILGRELAVSPFFRIYLMDKNKFHLFTQVGLGLGIVNRKFDLEDNFMNVAVGSYYNIHLNWRLGISVDITDKIRLMSGVSFDHFSNANTAEPNLGINYLSSYLGVGMNLGRITERIKGEIADHQAAIENEIVLSFGGKHSRALSTNYYQTMSFSFEKRKSFFKALHIGLGADIFYDGSIKDQLIDQNKKFQDHYSFQTGIHLTKSLVYNNFSLSLQAGIYLGLIERVEGYVMYNRGIVKYWISEKISVRLSMKSHLHILDYPEFGIGIKL